MSEKNLKEVFSRVNQETTLVKALKQGVLESYITRAYDSDMSRRKAGKGNEPIK